MKTLIFAFFAAVVLSGAGPSFAASCPGQPLKASFELWPAGQLNYGETRTGVHPCGKSVTCIGGNTHRGVPRTCKWS
jgi:hypothetical protein